MLRYLWTWACRGRDRGQTETACEPAAERHVVRRRRRSTRSRVPRRRSHPWTAGMVF